MTKRNRHCGIFIAAGLTVIGYAFISTSHASAHQYIAKQQQQSHLSERGTVQADD